MLCQTFSDKLLQYVRCSLITKVESISTFAILVQQYPPITLFCIVWFINLDVVIFNDWYSKLFMFSYIYMLVNAMLLIVNFLCSIILQSKLINASSILFMRLCNTRTSLYRYTLRYPYRLLHLDFIKSVFNAFFSFYCIFIVYIVFILSHSAHFFMDYCLVFMNTLLYL